MNSRRVILAVECFWKQLKKISCDGSLLDLPETLVNSINSILAVLSVISSSALFQCDTESEGERVS